MIEKAGSSNRFVPAGPRLAPDEWRAALKALEEVKAEWVIASGSLPPGVPTDFYARSAVAASRRGQKFVLDTSGPALRAVTGLGMELLKLSSGNSNPWSDNVIAGRQVEGERDRAIDPFRDREESRGESRT